VRQKKPLEIFMKVGQVHDFFPREAAARLTLFPAPVTDGNAATPDLFPAATFL
jgi:hypothetical protein